MKKRQLICSALAAALLVSGTVPGAGAARFADSAGHWSEPAIDRWSSYGVVVGADGRFHPDASITRGEMASIVAGMLGLEETAPDRYPDLNGGWYSAAMLKCVAAGIMTGDDHGRMRPYDNITGAEIAVMLTKALDLDSMGSSYAYPASATGYVKPWAQGYVNALASRGISIGNDGGMFQPMQDTSRAAVVSMFDRAVGTYVSAPGTYTVSGLTIINTSGTVTLRGSASGILVTDASDRVRLTLNDTRVTGGIELRADEVQLTAEDADITGDITVLGGKSRVSLNGDTEAGDITIDKAAQDSSVVLARSAQAGTITTGAPETDIAVNGRADRINLRPSASSSTIDVRPTGTVTALVSDADRVTVKGDGTLKRATITGDNNRIDTSATRVEVRPSASGTRVNGALRSPGTTTSSSSYDSDDSYSTRYTITYRLATDETNQTFLVYGSRRVYRGDYAYDLTVPAEKAPEGYVFAGWYTSTAGTAKFDFNGTKIREPYTVYGFWQKNPDSEEVKAVKAALREKLGAVTSDRIKRVAFPTDGKDTDCRVFYDGEYPATMMEEETGKLAAAILDAAKTGKAASLTVCGEEITLTEENAAGTISEAISDKNKDATAPNIQIEIKLTTTGGEEVTYTIGGGTSITAATTSELFMQHMASEYVKAFSVSGDITITAEALEPGCEKDISIESGSLKFTKLSSLPETVKITGTVLFIPTLQAAAETAFSGALQGNDGLTATASEGTVTISGTAASKEAVADFILAGVTALKGAEAVTEVKIGESDPAQSVIAEKITTSEAEGTSTFNGDIAISYKVGGETAGINVSCSGTISTQITDP